MNSVRTWCSNWFEQITEEAASYIFALLAIITSVIFSKLSQPTISQAFFWIASILMVIGILIYFAPSIKKIWGNAVGKLLLTIVTFMGTTVSFSMAGQVINYSLQVPSTPFIYTKSIVAVMVSPVVIAVFLAFTVLFLLVLMMPFLFFENLKLSPKGILTSLWKNEPKIIGFARFVAFILLISLCFQFLEYSQKYSEKVVDITRWYAFNMEMEEFTYCQVPNGIRVAYLDSGQIVLATSDEQGYQFNVVTCEKNAVPNQ